MEFVAMDEMNGRTSTMHNIHAFYKNYQYNTFCSCASVVDGGPDAHEQCSSFNDDFSNGASERFQLIEFSMWKLKMWATEICECNFRAAERTEFIEINIQIAYKLKYKQSFARQLSSICCIPNFRHRLQCNFSENIIMQFSLRRYSVDKVCASHITTCTNTAYLHFIVYQQSE